MKTTIMLIVCSLLPIFADRSKKHFGTFCFIGGAILIGVAIAGLFDKPQ